MSTIQLIGIGAATVILIILVIALIITRRREREKKLTASAELPAAAPSRPARRPSQATQQPGSPASDTSPGAAGAADIPEPPPPIVTSAAAGAAAGAAATESHDLWGAKPAEAVRGLDETPEEVWQTPSPAAYAMPADEAMPAHEIETPEPAAGPAEAPDATAYEVPAAPDATQASPRLDANDQTPPFEPPPTTFEAEPTLGETPPPLPAPPDTDAAAGWGGPLDEHPATEGPSGELPHMPAEPSTEPTPAAPSDVPPVEPITPEAPGVGAGALGRGPAEPGAQEAAPAPETIATPGADEPSPAATAMPIPPVPSTEPDSGSETAPRLVALCDIISTTNTQTVDLNDPDVRHMLRELVQNEVDLAQQYKQLGQNIDAVLQLTEAEKICRALSMDAHADLLQKMIGELQS